MVIDTSAIMAILCKEPDGPAFLQTILEADEPRISTVTALEAAIVSEGRTGPVAQGTVDDLVGMTSAAFGKERPPVVAPGSTGTGSAHADDHAAVYFPYFDMDMVFDDSRARAALEPAGIRCPHLADYFPRLIERREQLAGYLSGGEQQMLVIGRALMAKPRLLLLDEPSLGLAPLLVKEIFGIIQKINQERGTTFLLVEQNAQIALGIADYGYIMENGRVVLDGPADKLRGNDDVREFYLGLSEAGRRKSFREIKFYKRRKRWVF